jgi:hypothetical protein
MSTAGVIATIEALFTVHDEAGFASHYRDSTGAIVSESVHRNMDMAPCGEPYVLLTSNGPAEEGDAQPDLFFGSEGTALSWWRYAVEDLAENIAPRDKWKSLHLYWRQKPEYVSTTYVAMDQAGLLGSRSPLAAFLTIDVGFVTSRLLITKLDPNGEDGE